MQTNSDGSGRYPCLLTIPGLAIKSSRVIAITFPPFMSSVTILICITYGIICKSLLVVIDILVYPLSVNLNLSCTILFKYNMFSI